jgi:hypothetical protein
MNRRRWLAIALLLASACSAAAAAEQRVALVIGNASYRVDPLDNPVHDARLVAASLKQAGFDVTLAENLDRRGLLGAMRSFGQRLSEQTVAVLYYAGHGLQLRDRNYLIPVDAEIRSEDEIPVAGIDVAFILGRMSAARSRVNIVILDACRNNPFAEAAAKSGHRASGLAQMDAPVGTLLAYATAPGKLAADGLGSGANGVYAQQLARQLLTPGLPVEHVFKRVREAVVRASREAQVPWESSSLQGEFAFVPAADAAADSRVALAAPARVEAPAPPAAVDPALPRVGDRWRYRVQDQFRLGDLFVSTQVEAIGAQGIAEARFTSADATPRRMQIALAPAFTVSADAAPSEFSPYLQAAGLLGPALRGAELSQATPFGPVPLVASIEADEDVQVAAGHFRARKLVLRGQAQAHGAARSGTVVTEHRLWYASEVKRVVRHELRTTVGGELRESTSTELVEYRVQR